MRRIAPYLLLSFLILGCGRETIDTGPDTDAQGYTAPTRITADANAAFGRDLPLADDRDFQRARKGLTGQDPDLRIPDSRGGFVWNRPVYSFMDGDAPASVNPSLWRQGRLNNIHGLFKVTDGIFQLRGHDLANMTLIRGKTGWIVVDPLTAEETAERALALARKHLEDLPVRAVVFTHSHIDHFGGVGGVIGPEAAAASGVRIIAPKGFMAEATSENIIAGMAMGRRAMFMYGLNLPRSERGHVDSGLGKGPAYGTVGILPPTDIVDESGQEMVIDGIRFIFQHAPGTEAPAELAFYLPESRAFCGAEIVSHTLHNLYTLRGAKVRDALKWSAAIDESLTRFGGADVYFGCHHWPIWGNREIREFLGKQRDIYKYIHDQTVRLFNRGLTPAEIAEELTLPESLATSFYNRGYYGSLKHNAKAVYQAYLGWYDGNPANLDPLPPGAAGKRYVEMMGGAGAVLEKATAYFEQGEYRWVAQVLNHLVFAEPGNEAARSLLARTYDQLGYQAESGPWRDVYLTGAYELRHGAPERGIDLSVYKGLLENTPVSCFFDAMAVRLKGPEAQGKTISVTVDFTDRDEQYDLMLENAVLRHRRAVPGKSADVTIRITHDLFIRMLAGRAGIKETIFSEELSVDGSKLDLLRFLMLFEKPSQNFAIVTP